MGLQRYNRSLETLDLSKNPCCGPRLEGVRVRLLSGQDLLQLTFWDQIAALRSAFSTNTSLLRVFLADTDLSSEGAISLAEFLPDVRGLIHLDLTENFDVSSGLLLPDVTRCLTFMRLQIDIAGVMALAVSVKMNKTIRCLDLNIPVSLFVFFVCVPELMTVASAQRSRLCSTFTRHLAVVHSQHRVCARRVHSPRHQAASFSSFPKVGCC